MLFVFKINFIVCSKSEHDLTQTNFSNLEEFPTLGKSLLPPSATIPIRPYSNDTSSGSVRPSSVSSVDFVDLLGHPHERRPLGHLLDLSGPDVGAS